MITLPRIKEVFKERVVDDILHPALDIEVQC